LAVRLRRGRPTYKKSKEKNMVGNPKQKMRIPTYRSANEVGEEGEKRRRLRGKEGSAQKASGRGSRRWASAGIGKRSDRRSEKRRKTHVVGSLVWTEGRGGGAKENTSLGGIKKEFDKSVIKQFTADSRIGIYAFTHEEQRAHQLQ